MATRERTRRKVTRQGKPATKRVTAKLYQGGDIEAEEVIVDDLEVVVFETDPAYVRVNGGYTGNLGNYRSFRVDVSISVPCYQEMVDQTFEEVAAHVNDLLTNEVARFTEELSDV